MALKKVSVITTIAETPLRSTKKRGVTLLTQLKDGIGVLYQRAMV